MPKIAKAIERLDGVQSVKFDPGSGLFIIAPKARASLEFARLPPAIRNAMSEDMRFFTEQIRIVASGIVENSRGASAFRIRGWPDAFTIPDSKLFSGIVHIEADVVLNRAESAVDALQNVRIVQ
ncbi:MAG: hypothetical protein HY286_17300 [Planctomycetes bacterium]|nr:hypothetical protein [Planctomycetota bacterium]